MSFYILFAYYDFDNNHGKIVSLYTSLSNLSKGVDYHKSRLYSDCPLYFVEYEGNNHMEPNNFNWCYVPKTSDINFLLRLSECIPSKSDWGKNLIDYYDFEDMTKEEIEREYNDDLCAMKVGIRYKQISSNKIYRIDDYSNDRISAWREYIDEDGELVGEGVDLPKEEFCKEFEMAR
jgi:hypothetical protein